MKDPWEALSDPTRREILQLLQGGPLNASGICENFSFTKSTVSRHLEVLEDSGLVESEKRRQYVYYRLREGAFYPLRDFLDSLAQSSTKEEPDIIEAQVPMKTAPAGYSETIRKPASRVEEQREAVVPTAAEPKEDKPPVKQQSRKGRVPSYLD